MPQDNEIESKVDELIGRAADRLESFDEETEEYAKTLDKFEKLHKLRKTLAPEPAPVVIEEKPVDKDRVRFKDFIPLIGSLGGIAIIVVFESFGHTLTSKATAFVSKSR